MPALATRNTTNSSLNWNRRRIGPEREALVKQLNDTYVQGYYEIPLVDRGAVSAHLNTLLGVRINGWDSELWNIAEWRR